MLRLEGALARAVNYFRICTNASARCRGRGSVSVAKLFVLRLDTQIHNDSNILPLVITSRVRTATGSISEKLEFGGNNPQGASSPDFRAG